MKPSEKIEEKARMIYCDMYGAESQAEPTISNYISAILDYLDETLNDEKIREIKKGGK